MDGKFYKKLMLNGLGKSNYRKVSKVSRGTGNVVRRFIPDLSDASAENKAEIAGIVAGASLGTGFSIARHNKMKKISHANASHIKIAGPINLLRRAIGYHDVGRIAKDTGVDYSNAQSLYHSLRAPNEMLYSHKDVSNDIKRIDGTLQKYRKIQNGLISTRQDSPEEKSYLKQHGKTLDDLKANYLNDYNSTRQKYYSIKNKR